MTKKICIVCQNMITLARGKAMKRCQLCRNTVCDFDCYPCYLCGNDICTNDLVNFQSNGNGAKTSAQRYLKCKSCAKMERESLEK